tara:strand:+ start:426 stop:686 length:261 start_codon:yes stop_codon:yes gene_type:complete
MKLTRKQLKEMVREELKNLKEADPALEKAPIPGQVKRFMAKFIDSVGEAKLNRMKKMSILYKVIKSLGISPKELVLYMTKIKKGLK